MKAISEITTLKSHAPGVKSFVLSENNKMMISGGYDKKIRFWCMENNFGYSKRNSLTMFHNEYIRCLKLSKDETRLFSGAADHLIGN